MSVAVSLLGPAIAAPLSIEEIHGASFSAERPLSVSKEDRAAREEWKQKVDWYQSLPVDQVVAHPQAADFPGAVQQEASRGERTVAIDASQVRWQSTGLYAPPGEAVTVTLPASAARLGWKLRIGCHSDNIMPWQSEWKRFPVISREYPLEAKETRVANAFGGLIYIDIPRDEARGGTRVPTFGGYGWIEEKPQRPAPTEIKISGAVDAPYYRAGVTRAEDWQRQLAASGAPWGEIAGKNLILSLPIEQLRAVEDPAGLAAFWDRVLDGCWSFAGWPGERQVAERFVFDRQISNGWMHSGYPIMAHLVSAKEAANLATLQSKGDWGFFHELGHNHQGRFYTFDGFTEVTVNLHTLYLMKHLCGLGPESRREIADLDAVLAKRLKDQVKGPFEHLALYLPLIQEFGYESLTKTFQTYLKELERDERRSRRGRQREQGDESLQSEWVRRFSETVQRDCSGYFALFDISCTPAVKKELSQLSPWMPDATFAERFAVQATLEAE